MPLNSVKTKLAERMRASRQAHNDRQVFFKLPAEIRNHIYDLILAKDNYIFQYRLFRQETATFDRFADSRHVWNRDRQWYSQVSTPALFRVCRQMRIEFMPMLMAVATVSLHVNVPNVRKTTFGNEESFVDVFEDVAIGAVRRVEIRNDYECDGREHKLGYAGPKKSTALDSLKVVIDRVTGRVDIVTLTRQGEIGRRRCCREASWKSAERLVSDIKALELHKSSLPLRRENLRKLTQDTSSKTSKAIPSMEAAGTRQGRPPRFGRLQRMLQKKSTRNRDIEVEKGCC